MTAPARKVTTDLGAVLDIPIASMRPFAKQPRKRFDQAALSDLMASIEAVGQQVPVTVRPLGKGDAHAYELVDGERRFWACQRLKRTTIRAWVRDVADEGEQFLASVVSNFARADHTMMEIAEAVGTLKQRPDIAILPHGEQMTRVGAIFGRSQAWAYTFEWLLGLIPEARSLLSGEPNDHGLPFVVAGRMGRMSPPLQKRIVDEIVRTGARNAQIQAIVERIAQSSGASKAYDQPARRWTGIRTGFSALCGQAERLSIVPRDTLRNGLARLAPGERQVFLREIDRALGQVTEFAQAVRRIVGEGVR